MKESGWTPVARGKIFCSPRCGGGCTRAQHDQAVARGRALAAILGRGWTGVVWENLGWHFKAEHARAGVEVYTHGPRRFWATTSYTKPRHARQVHADGATPRKAVRAMLAELNAIADMWTDIRTQIGKAIA